MCAEQPQLLQDPLVWHAGKREAHDQLVDSQRVPKTPDLGDAGFGAADDEPIAREVLESLNRGLVGGDDRMAPRAKYPPPSLGMKPNRISTS
jgi:hypothetical protein